MPVSRARTRTRAEQIQSRRFVLIVCLLALSVVVTAVASYSSRAEASAESATERPVSTVSSTSLDRAAGLASETYIAELKGESRGTGSPRALLRLKYDADAKTATYALDITSALANPNTAVICHGTPGQSGSTVLTIFSGPTVSGRFSGMLAQGEISAADLVGPLQGKRLADLMLMIEDGEAYATVGTAGVPVDAVRGQIGK